MKRKEAELSSMSDILDLELLLSYRREYTDLMSSSDAIFCKLQLFARPLH